MSFVKRIEFIFSLAFTCFLSCRLTFVRIVFVAHLLRCESNAVWGAFNPYPIDAIKAGGKFIPLRPFSSLSSVGYYAGLFGSIALVKCSTSNGLALARNKLDVWNDLLGVAAVYSYASYLFRGSDKRITWNNRCLAGIAIGSIVYANTSP